MAKSLKLKTITKTYSSPIKKLGRVRPRDSAIAMSLAKAGKSKYNTKTYEKARRKRFGLTQ